MPSSRHVRMTRTAISPRLAIRTLLSMVRLWLAHRLGCAPIRRVGQHQPAGVGARSGWRGRRRGDRRRPPDGRSRPAGTELGGAAGRIVADVGPVAAAAGAERLHLVVAAVALAGAEAVDRVSGVRPSLKWPNDLVVGDRKLAGVLAETDGAAVVVGIGVNLNWPDPLPDELAAIATAVNHLVATRPVDRDAVLAAL